MPRQSQYPVIGMRRGGLCRPSVPVTFTEYLEQAKKNEQGQVILQITRVKASLLSQHVNKGPRAIEALLGHLLDKRISGKV